MEIIKKQLFFEIIKQMDTVPFTQSKGWDKYMSTNDNSVILSIIQRILLFVVGESFIKSPS